MKISDLPGISYSNYQQVYLVGNMYYAGRSELETGTISVDDLMSSYLSTSTMSEFLVNYLDSMPNNDHANYIVILSSWLDNHDGLDSLQYCSEYMAHFLSNTHNCIDEFMSKTWEVDSWFFENDTFTNPLSSYISDWMYDHGLYMDSIVNELTTTYSDSMYQWLCSCTVGDSSYMSSFASELFEHQTYTSELTSWLDDNMGSLLSAYLSERNSADVASLFATAMRYYISYYGPLPS